MTDLPCRSDQSGLAKSQSERRRHSMKDAAHSVGLAMWAVVRQLRQPVPRVEKTAHRHGAARHRDFGKAAASHQYRPTSARPRGVPRPFLRTAPHARPNIVRLVQGQWPYRDQCPGPARFGPTAIVRMRDFLAALHSLGPCAPYKPGLVRELSVGKYHEYCAWRKSRKQQT